MTEIKRYDMEKEYSLDINVIPVEGHDGSFVRYDDYRVVVDEKDVRIAALQEQVLALAAEAEALKNYIKSECFIMEVGAHPMAEADISAEERMPETPATAAAIREVRAQAVEGFAEHIALYNSNSKSHALSYAARILSGEQS